MALSALEIISLVFVALALAKFVVALLNRQSWFTVSKLFYDNARESAATLIILGIILFFFLLEELTIAEIISVLALASIIVGLVMLQYPREFMHLAKKSLNKKMSLIDVIYISIWFVLLIWALIEIFR